MSKSSTNLAPVVIFLVLLALLGGGLLLLFRDGQAPLVSLSPETTIVGPRRTLTLTLNDETSGIKDLTVKVTQSARQRTLFEKSYQGAPKNVQEPFTLEEAGLQDGTLTLEVETRDASLAGFGKGNLARFHQQLTLDAKNPVISVLSGAHNIRGGGAGCVTYQISEAAASTGVTVGDLFFPGYLQDDGRYFCLFAYPYYMTEEEFQPRVVASDLAGNESVRGFRFHLINRPYKEDDINLSDGFLNSKMPEFEAQVPGQMTQLERFLKVNREIRQANRSALLGIGRQTSPRKLWEKDFVRMPGQTMATFGDRRSYKYKGEVVDNQTHLGVDIASTQHAEVPAANAGRVVFAGDMGIYGQAVIIDHGLGLQSLHAHLSELRVKTGDEVQRGQTVGLSGTSGMAGGDHLHLGILISGLPVNPLEWWDAQWIRHNITDRMEPGGS